MKFIETPVCIVGAGPAGTTASLFLSQYGIPHIMADKCTFPRDKVCGEVFSGRVPHVLRELDIDYKELIQQGIVQETRRIRFHVGGAKSKNIDFNFNEKSTSILKGKRSIFDDFLNKKARESLILTYLDGVHLNKIEPNTDPSRLLGEGVILKSSDSEYQIKAQLVIMCTGERIPFLQDVLSEKYSSKGETLFIWRQYYKNIYYDTLDFGVEAHLFTQPFDHYLIINPLPDNLSLVEVSISKKDYKKHNIPLETVFDKAINSTSDLKSRFRRASPLEKGKGIAMLLGMNPRLLSAERFLLAGSAAGSIHPTTGFGVGHAMRMGQLAALQALKSIEKNDFSADYLKNYDSMVRKRMREDFRLGNVLDFVVRHFKLFLPILRLVIFSKFMVKLVASDKFKMTSLNPFVRLKRVVK